MLTFGVALIKHSKVDSLIQNHEIKLSTKKQIRIRQNRRHSTEVARENSIF